MLGIRIRMVFVAGIMLMFQLQPKAELLFPEKYPLVNDSLFPLDRYTRAQAAFIYEIYSEVDDDAGLLYDPYFPQVVIAKISFSKLSRKMAQDSLQRAKLAYQGQIIAYLNKARSAWSLADYQIDACFPPNWSKFQKRKSAQRLLVKKGKKQTFEKSYANSKPFIKSIEKVLKRQALPQRLKYLPHVESGFVCDAVSPEGAKGLWQVLPGTASHYLQLDSMGEEQIDSLLFNPDQATRIASKILETNQKALRSWALAIMAYNNGLGGIRGATKRLGSRHPSHVIRNVHREDFQMASRFYYAKFVALASLAENRDKAGEGIVLAKVDNTLPEIAKKHGRLTREQRNPLSDELVSFFNKIRQDWSFGLPEKAILTLSE